MGKAHVLEALWVIQSCCPKINLNKVGLTLCTSARRHQSDITSLHMCEKNASHPRLRLPERYQEKNQLTAIDLKLHLGGLTTGGL
jgi:hypothetical protein